MIILIREWHGPYLGTKCEVRHVVMVNSQYKNDSYWSKVKRDCHRQHSNRMGFFSQFMTCYALVVPRILFQTTTTTGI
jgi:hypothetical protein